MTNAEKIYAAIERFDPEVVKTVIKVIVKTSVSGTCITLIHAATPTCTKTQKVKLYIGAAVMANMLADNCADWAYEKFVATLAAVKDLLPKRNDSSAKS